MGKPPRKRVPKSDLPYKADLLHEWMKELSLTEEALAARAGLSRPTVSRIKAGTFWTLESLGACAAACGKTLSDLLTPEAAKKFGILATYT